MIKHLTLSIVKFRWIYKCFIYIRQIQSMNEQISEIFDFNLVVLCSRQITIQVKLSKQDFNFEPAIC